MASPTRINLAKSVRVACLTRINLEELISSGYPAHLGLTWRNRRLPSPTRINLEEPIRVASPNRVNLEEPIRVASPTRINLEEPSRVASPTRINLFLRLSFCP